MEEKKVDEWDLQHSTQGISLFVGGLLTIMGVWGIFFTGIAGLTLQISYGLLVATAGLVLIYFGYQNRSFASFLTCSIFASVFGILGIFGLRKVPGDYQDTMFNVLANYKEQGSVDYVINLVLALVLLGGAIDWMRRYRAEKTTGPTPAKKIDHPHRGTLIPH